MPTSPFLAPHRDHAARVGRYKTGSTTYLTIPGVAIAGNTLKSAPINRDYYSVMVVSSPIVVTDLILEVTTLASSGNGRIGIYRADANFQPVGAPLADSGNISTASTGQKVYTPSTPLTLQPGRYLQVSNFDVQPDLRQITGAVAGGGHVLLNASAFAEERYVSRSYAAFPTPGTAWDTVVEGGSVGYNRFALRVREP